MLHHRHETEKIWEKEEHCAGGSGDNIPPGAEEIWQIGTPVVSSEIYLIKDICFKLKHFYTLDCTFHLRYFWLC